MSRPIKFRAFNTAAKCYYPVEHFALRLDGQELQLMPDNAFHPNSGSMVYEQFTGLTDKNGHDCYEGDIVEHPFYKERWEIYWNNEQSRFLLRSEGKSDRIMEDIKYFEIVGNKWES